MNAEFNLRPPRPALGRQPSIPWSLSKSPSRDSMDRQDPLSQSLPRSDAPSTQPNAHGRSRLAVVLSGSPRQQPGGGIGTTDEYPRPFVISDVSRQGRRVAPVTATPIPLPPYATSFAAATTATAAAATARVPYSSGRGRPKGWKPGMRYSELRGDPLPRVRQTKPQGTAKRRGRPPKQPSPPPTTIYRTLKPTFLAYLCEWAGCKAELHNLDTLRRHVYVVHGKGATCLWGECRGDNAPKQMFSNDEEMETHMEDVHLIPMSWHVGDGPVNDELALKKKDEGVPDFLRDKDGVQVTPSVREQVLEDTDTWKTNRRKLKELLRRRDENLPDDDSDDDDEVAEEL